MKIVHPNDIKIQANPRLPETIHSPRELVKNLIKINNEHIHYVKSEFENNLIDCHMHPFVEAVHIAYSEHLSVTISPDMIWNLITSGVAQHINKNVETLKKTFVDHDGKKVGHKHKPKTYIQI